MNKYELALVVNAKIEDEERAAVVEKAKEYITRFGGTITNVDDWGKKRLAYEIQKMREGFSVSSLMQVQTVRLKLKNVYGLWTMCCVSYALGKMRHNKRRLDE